VAIEDDQHSCYPESRLNVVFQTLARAIDTIGQNMSSNLDADRAWSTLCFRHQLRGPDL
jgi:hypothetical protein